MSTSLNSHQKKWSEFLEFCENCASSNWWFRGVTDTSHELVPKVGRGFEGKKWKGPIEDGKKVTFAQREERIFNAFRRRARLELQFLPTTTFEWLALAQHHGVPTRLLDWTPNPLIAAWFATSSKELKSPSKKGTPKRIARVYAVRVRSNRKGDEDKIEPFKLDSDGLPIFVISPHWHSRVRAQRGCFSVHPTPNKPLEFGKLENCSFDIEERYWRAFRRRLFYFGIDASTVMSDLSGLGSALEWQLRDEIGIGEVGY